MSEKICLTKEVGISFHRIRYLNVYEHCALSRPRRMGYLGFVHFLSLPGKMRMRILPLPSLLLRYFLLCRRVKLIFLLPNTTRQFRRVNNVSWRLTGSTSSLSSASSTSIASSAYSLSTSAPSLGYVYISTKKHVYRKNSAIPDATRYCLVRHRSGCLPPLIELL